MTSINVGLVADPSAPTAIARRFDARDVEVLSTPFTRGFEDVDTAVEQLQATRTSTTGTSWSV